MEGPRQWSREQAIVDALVEHRLPPSKRHHTVRMETALSLQPMTLRSGWDDVLARLPAPWRQRAEEIFVFAPPLDRDSSPEAFAKGRSSHRVEIPRGFLWLLEAFGEAHFAVVQPVSEFLLERDCCADCISRVRVERQYVLVPMQRVADCSAELAWLQSADGEDQVAGYDLQQWPAATWVLHSMYENASLRGLGTHDEVRRRRLESGDVAPLIVGDVNLDESTTVTVSYTHLTLPTNREV